MAIAPAKRRPAIEPPRREPKTGPGRARRVADQLVVVAITLLFWELTAAIAGSFFFPRPSAVLLRLYKNWFSGPASAFFLTPGAWRDMVPSLLRMLAGWGIAVVLGVALGTILGVSRKLSQYVDPIIHVARSAPGPALLPVFLLVFGIGTNMKVAFIAFGTIWPILLNTRDGVRSVEPAYTETAAVFRVDRSRWIRRVVLPAAMPKVVAGLRISLAIALVLMVISDMLASSGGFGFALILAQREFRILDLWAAMVLLGVIGYIINTTFLSIEHRGMAWHYGFRRRGGE